MGLMSPILIGFTIMVMASFLLGAFSRGKTDSLKSYFWGDNKLKSSHTTHLLLSTSFSMNGILYQTWLGYKIGFVAVFLQIIWCLSYILLSFKAERIRKLSDTGTLHGNIGHIFGTKAEIVAAFASIIGFTLQVGWELIVGVSIFNSTAPNNQELQTILILTLALIGAIYTILGGLRGNLLANRVQNWTGGLALVSIIIFLILDPTHISTNSTKNIWEINFESLFTELGIMGFIINAIFSLCWQYVDMSAWQNIASTTTEKNSSRNALLWTSLWVFVFPGLVGTIAGMYLRTIPNLTSDNIVSHLVSILSNYPYLAFFVAAGFVATMLSTIDGLLLAGGQAITWDLTQRKAVKEILRDINQKQENKSEEFVEKELSVLTQTKIWVLVIAFLGGGFVYWITTTFKVSIFDLVYLVVVAQMVLFPVVHSILYGDDQKKRFGFSSILFGLLFGAIMFFYSIITKNNDLLPWVPFIALITSFSVRYIYIINPNSRGTA